MRFECPEDGCDVIIDMNEGSMYLEHHALVY